MDEALSLHSSIGVVLSRNTPEKGAYLARHYSYKIQCLSWDTPRIYLFSSVRCWAHRRRVLVGLDVPGYRSCLSIPCSHQKLNFITDNHIPRLSDIHKRELCVQIESNIIHDTSQGWPVDHVPSPHYVLSKLRHFLSLHFFNMG